MKFILRLGLALLTGFVSVSTASAQAYGTADTNAPELRVPKSVQPAFDSWMRDTWATLGPDGYYYIQRPEDMGSHGTNLVNGKRRYLAERSQSI